MSETILIAEDNNDSREMLRVFLEYKGYRVIEARDGREAVRLAFGCKPDLILIDLNMPELDGLRAVEQIRRQSELSEIPILANSSDGRRGIDLFLNVKKLGRGYIEYIAKPLNLDSLAYLIESALGGVRKAA